ncbi:MAG: LysE family transporter, partial [Bacteroidota bacterium]
WPQSTGKSYPASLSLSLSHFLPPPPLSFLSSFATSLLAILFGALIQMFLNENSWIQVVVFSIFIGLGIYNLVRKTHPKLKERSKLKVSEFVKGFAVSLANPQAVPFWIFTLAFISQQVELDLMGVPLVWFLTGVFLGKLAALSLFGVLSFKLKDRLQKSCNLINKSFGAILLLIGLIQAFQFFAN